MNAKIGCSATAVLALVVSGCSDRSAPQPTDAGVDSAVCDPAATDDVDLLFVLDRGPAAHEARAVLAESMPSGLQALASGDLDLDGVADQAPIGSLHVGVITGDLGTSGFAPLGCAPSLAGDGGQLLISGDGAGSCAVEYPRYQTIEPGGTSASDAAQAVRCIIRNVADGCPISQVLEASLVALAPPDWLFLADLRGQGDGANAGFLRPLSALVIVYLAASEDCSASRADFLDPTSARYPDPLPLRCATIPIDLNGRARYLDGLNRLQRVGGRHLFGGIAGIPPDLIASAREGYQILSDPRMQQRPSTSDPTRLEPVCQIPPVVMGGRLTSAEPAFRIVDLATYPGVDGVLSSICAPDYPSFYRRLGEHIARAREPTCAR